MSNPVKHCHHQTLARNSVAHVQRCDECGCVTIHMGPVSVRLDDGSAEGLWVVLSEALSSMHALPATPATAAFPTVRGKA